jgi:hypothetical protein
MDYWLRSTRVTVVLRERERQRERERERERCMVVVQCGSFESLG